MKQDLTVFMYHRVLPFEHPEAVTPELFSDELDFLKAHYTFLTPEEAYVFIRSGKAPGSARHYAMLSFDDGWLDNLLFAHPVLVKHGLSAAMAVSTGTLQPGEVRTEAPQEMLSLGMDEARIVFDSGKPGPFLNRSEIQSMAQSGVWAMEIHGTIHKKGSAGCSRLARPEKDQSDEEFRNFLRQDLLECKRILEELTGKEPQAMFWPWGHYSDLSLQVVKELGIDIQFTVKKGVIHPDRPYAVLPRIGVSKNVKKLKKNVFVFQHPLFALIHNWFHTEQVCFND